jgi:hypothetical protein
MDAFNDVSLCRRRSHCTALLAPHIHTQQHCTNTVAAAAIAATAIATATTVGEAAIRSVYEGFTTDATRPVQIWALDFKAADGTFTKRNFGKVLPDPGPLGAVGAVQGLWRFRPQCVVDGGKHPFF